MKWPNEMTADALDRQTVSDKWPKDEMAADASDRQMVFDKWPVANGLRLSPSAGQSERESVRIIGAARWKASAT